MSLRFTLALALALLAPPPLLPSAHAEGPAPACTVTVSPGASVAEAIVAAAHGQVICVAPGTYKGKIDFHGKRIRVIGLGGPERTVLDGAGAGPVVEFSHREGRASTLEGFTITGGRFNRGAGVRLMGASPTLRRLVVRGNHATDGAGGGVAMEEGSGPLMEACTVTGNRASEGGGVALESASVLTMIGGVISKNQATQVGGGIATRPGSGLWLSNVILDGNRAGQHAGGIYLKGSPARLKNTILRGNHADQWGGAMFVYLGSSALMQNVIVVDNTAKNMGGGVYVEFAHAVLENVTLAGNVSIHQGGGLRLWNSMVVLRNLAVIKNGGGGGGGIRSSAKQPGSVTARYVYSAGNDPELPPSFKLGPGPRGGAEDKHLLDTTAKRSRSWDLHLAPGSPMVDGGDPALKDPDGSRSDIGAFGGPGAAWWDLDSDGARGWWRPGKYSRKKDQGKDCADEDPARNAKKGCR